MKNKEKINFYGFFGIVILILVVGGIYVRLNFIKITDYPVLDKLYLCADSDDCSFTVKPQNKGDFIVTFDTLKNEYQIQVHPSKIEINGVRITKSK